MKNCLYILILLLLVSCKETSSLLADFPKGNASITEFSNKIAPDNLGLIEGIHCNDSFLVTLDFHNRKSYSLFNLANGTIVKRFGEIGNGHLEIPIGCEGSIYNDKFIVFDDETKQIASYTLSPDSNLVKCDTIEKYKISQAQFTKVIPISKGKFLGMGTYNDKYQYVIFDDKNKVLDYQHEIFNAEDKQFNTYHKFLTNQGYLARHPSKPLFVGAIRYSSNIDFFKIDGQKIKNINSWNGENPQYIPQQRMGISQVVPSDDAINGVINLCATNNYIFTLYSEMNLKKEPHKSKIILVFDWNGNKLCKIDMKNDIYYIAANEKALYTVEKDKDKKYVIKSYHYKISQGI